MDYIVKMPYIQQCAWQGRSRGMVAVVATLPFCELCLRAPPNSEILLLGDPWEILHFTISQQRRHPPLKIPGWLRQWCLELEMSYILHKIKKTETSSEPSPQFQPKSSCTAAPARQILDTCSSACSEFQGSPAKNTKVSPNVYRGGGGLGEHGCRHPPGKSYLYICCESGCGWGGPPPPRFPIPHCPL